jgi:hypothetical protein
VNARGGASSRPVLTDAQPTPRAVLLRTNERKLFFLLQSLSPHEPRVSAPARERRCIGAGKKILCSPLVLAVRATAAWRGTRNSLTFTATPHRTVTPARAPTRILSPTSLLPRCAPVASLRFPLRPPPGPRRRFRYRRARERERERSGELLAPLPQPPPFFSGRF